MIEKAIDYKACSQMTGLAERTLRNYVSQKRIPFYKLGKAVRFSPSRIEAWMEAQAVPTLNESLGACMRED